MHRRDPDSPAVGAGDVAVRGGLLQGLTHEYKFGGEKGVGLGRRGPRRTAQQHEQRHTDEQAGATLTPMHPAPVSIVRGAETRLRRKAFLLSTWTDARK